MHIHGILLAAGSSSRFNGIKQLASLDGETMLTGAIRQFDNSQLSSFSVALGAHVQDIIKTLPSKVNIHQVQGWQDGMGSTISEMTNLVPDQSTHILIGLADQVAVSVKQLDALIQKATECSDRIISAKYRQTLGVPVIFPVTYKLSLQGLDGQKGAKLLLQQHSANCIAVDMPEAAIDIDTPEQLQDWLTSLSR